MWFNADGEQSLKESYVTDGTLVCTEKAMQHLDLFLTQSKVLQKSYKCLFKVRTITLIWLSVFHSTAQQFSLRLSKMKVFK